MAEEGDTASQPTKRPLYRRILADTRPLEESGVVASVTSPIFSAVSGGLASVVGVALLGLLRPAFARYDSRKQTTSEARV
jgi:hypothetical protein